MMFASCCGDGSQDIIRVHRPADEKQKLRERLVWIIVSNLLLLKRLLGQIRYCLLAARHYCCISFPPEPDHRDEAHLPHHGLSPRVSHCRAQADGFSAKRAAPPHAVGSTYSKCSDGPDPPACLRRHPRGQMRWISGSVRTQARIREFSRVRATIRIRSLEDGVAGHYIGWRGYVHRPVGKRPGLE
jgi:hypothetical protein